MDTCALANEIATQVVAQTPGWVHAIGLLGVVLGAVITALGNFLLQRSQDRQRRELDEARKTLLRSMLEDEKHPGRWRKLSTLSRVVGADDSVTSRLLFEIGARGSEKDDQLWGLLKYHPLDELGQ